VGEYAQSVDLNRTADIDRINQQMQGFNTAAQSANNTLRQPVQPSFLDAALRIGAGGLDAYHKYLYVPGRPMGAGNTDVPINRSPSYPSRTNDPFGGF
jgi:hypothetical protein